MIIKYLTAIIDKTRHLNILN